MVSYATVPPLLSTPVRKVGAPLAAIMAMGTVAALILILLTTIEPVGAIRALLLTTVAMACVLACYLWLDRWEPEPPRLLVMAFLWGASVAVVVSVLMEHVINAALSGADQKPGFAVMAFAAPVIEEAAKGCFLVLMMTGRRRIELNNLTDCLVYAGFTAAGFAWMEDIFYIASAESVPASWATAILRLVIGPFAHPLFTTMTAIGVYFALKQRGRGGQVLCVLLGYLAAVAIHALWNGSALLGSKTYMHVYVVWMMPVFALAIVLAVMSRRRERQIIAAKMPGMVSAGLLTPTEAGWACSLKARKAAVRSAGQFGGRQAASSVKRFVVKVVELAYVRDRIDRGYGDDRVFALEAEEANGLLAARAAAAPALQQLHLV